LQRFTVFYCFYTAYSPIGQKNQSVYSPNPLY
jgi:hypothetical protein